MHIDIRLFGLVYPGFRSVAREQRALDVIVQLLLSLLLHEALGIMRYTLVVILILRKTRGVWLQVARPGVAAPLAIC